ncbi:MAG: prepilin-type N-terminal cleavage/methylation domain-containing protein [Rubrivivax sp.]|nr:prepilin-type N-terminal cleavage/methylation domain-containing protein [Rubrivivax sp.]
MLSRTPRHFGSTQARPARQRGLSIVEMLVGVTVGLIIVAAATLMVAGQLADNRRLLLETQVQQDLRAATDLVTRELRRAGFWKDAPRSTSAAAVLLPRLSNPYTAMAPALSGETGSLVSFSYADRDRTENNAVDSDERHGFRLSNGTIETQLGAGNWQPLTDPAVLRITRFDVRAQVQPVTLECPLACSAGATPCPPVQQVRSYTVDITGEAANDARVQRSIRSTVRVRNDVVIGECRD